MGVFGDSIAWGQGLLDDDKYAIKLIEDIDEATPGSVRTFFEAHSGATVHNFGDDEDYEDVPPVATIVDQENCDEDRDVHGEVSRNLPSIPCQIQNVSFAEYDTLPSLNPITFDTGPRFDYAFTTACINDMNAARLVMGLAGLNDEQTLIDTIGIRCDLLSNGLQDIRLRLPNAVVAISGYHLIISDQTDLDRANCPTNVLEGFIGGAIGGFIAGPPGAAIGALAFAMLIDEELTEGAAARSTTFKAVSDQLLQASVDHANSLSVLGRGTIEFVPTRWSASSSIYAENSLAWELHCSGLFPPLILWPEDDVISERFSACDGYHSEILELEVCYRGSGFHPNREGAGQIYRSIKRALQIEGLFPTH